MKNKRQRGFTILELIVVIAVSTIIAIAAVPAIVWKTEEAGMEATGVYMSVLKSALEKYNLINHDALVAGTPIVGFANPLAPTVNELIAAKLVASPSFPSNTPQRIPVSTQIVLQTCPGVTCRIFGIAYTTRPQVYVGTTDIRYDLVASYLASPGAAGSGASSQQGSEGVLKSAVFSVPNPVAGTPGGIIAIGTYLDEGIFANFVKIRDTRDPDLQGGMTLSGLLPSGNALDVNGNVKVAGKSNFLDDVTVTDAGTGTVCVKIYKAGQVDVNCSGILNAKAGTFTGPFGVVKVGDTGAAYTVDSTGKVRGQAGFFTALNSVFGDNPNGVRFGGGAFTVQNSAGSDQLAVNTDGSVQARKTIASPILSLTDPVVQGSACGAPGAISPAGLATNAGTTAIASAGNGTLVSCVAGIWSPLTKTGNVGDACTPEGSSATDPTGVQLLCSGGQLIPLSDRFGSLIFSDSHAVPDGGTVPKPFCASGSSGARVYLISKDEVQNSQYVNRYTVDLVATWQVFIRNGVGTPVVGNVIAQTYCAY